MRKKPIHSKILCKLTMLLLSFAMMTPGVTVCHADEPIAVYVATNGSDAASGSIDEPLKTLTAARDKIRSLRAEHGADKSATVYIRGGEYEMREQLLLTEEDSGTEECPVIWRNYQDETVTLTGGVSVMGSAFSKETSSSLLRRIADKTARQSVYKLDLKQFGIEDPGEPYYRGSYSYSSSLEELGLVTEPEDGGIEVFYNGEAMTLARYPNEGMLTVSGVVEPGWSMDDPDAYPAGTPFTISVDDDRMKYWTTASEGTALLYGFWKWKWADQTIPIGSVDGRNKQITTEWSSVFSVVSGAPFYAFNLFEEMDAEGEYYIDRENCILYVNVPDGIKDTDKFNLSLTEDDLIYIKGADYVSFQGITVKATRNSPFRIDECTGCSVKHCEIYNTADYGVMLFGNDNTVSDCHIYDTNGGVSVGGGSERYLTPANNQVLNCHIERFSRIDKTYKPAVNLGGVGNLAAFNEIHNAPHQAIAYGGNNNKIYYNEIYDVVQSTDDAGAIYGGLSWVSRGHEVKYNYIHDLSSDQPGVGIWGVFLDGGQCSMTVEGNIFENIDGEAVFVSGGCDNTVHNNYMINCEAAVSIIQSIDTPEKLYSHHYPRLYSFIWKDGEWKSDIWKEAYPEFYAMMQLPDEEKIIPKNNIFTNNMCYETESFVVRNPVWLQGGYESVNYVATEDPGFVSLGENRDYSLKKDAPVLSVLPTLERLPFNCMGLKGSPACMRNGFYCDKNGDDIICRLCYMGKTDETATIYYATYNQQGNAMQLDSVSKGTLYLKADERLHVEKTIPIDKHLVFNSFLWKQETLEPLCAAGTTK